MVQVYQAGDGGTVFTTRKGSGYTPGNYDGRFHGPVTVREALASSLNVPAVEMLRRVGLDALLSVSHALGISSLSDTGRYDLSLTLGGGELTLLDLTTGYASFARHGRYIPTYAIDTVKDDGGKLLYTHTLKPGVEVFGPKSSQISYLVTSILSDPKARMPGFGEKNPLVLSRPAAVKTGTTTDWHDNWTVGYTPSLTVGVWVGNTDNHPMKKITGIVGAAPIWNQVFEEMLKGKPVETFERPEGITEKEICKSTGLLYDGVCPEKYTEVFMNGTEPDTVSSAHRKIAVDIRNGLKASDSCPREYTETRTFEMYPGELYSWARDSGREMPPESYSPLCSGDGRQDTPFIRIVYPRPETVFERPQQSVANPNAVFEVQVSPAVSRVRWILDGLPGMESTEYPFRYIWPLTLGEHTVQAIAVTSDGRTVSSETVRFTVLDYAQVH